MQRLARQTLGGPKRGFGRIDGGVEIVPLSERLSSQVFWGIEILRTGRASLATDNQLTGVQSPPAWVWLGTRTRVPLVARRD